MRNRGVRYLPSKRKRSASSISVDLPGVDPGEGRVGGTGVREQTQAIPDRADAEDVTHFMSDDITEGSVVFHLQEVCRVEFHDPFGRDHALGSQGCRPRLPEDVAGAIDARTASQ